MFDIMKLKEALWQTFHWFRRGRRRVMRKQERIKVDVSSVVSQPHKETRMVVESVTITMAKVFGICPMFLVIRRV